MAIVDIDVHFGNGTAEIVKNNNNIFFASVHMIYGNDNKGIKNNNKHDNNNSFLCDGFYPKKLGSTYISENFISVGINPEKYYDIKQTKNEKNNYNENSNENENENNKKLKKGSEGFRQALSDIIIPNLKKFNPQLLIISGFYFFIFLFSYIFILIIYH